MSLDARSPSEPAPWRLVEPHLGLPFAFLMDRAGAGRASFAGSAPSRLLVVARNGTCTEFDARGPHSVAGGDPIAVIDAFVESSQARPQTLPGWLSPDAPLPRTVGYFSYELASWIERVPVLDNDPIGAPLAVLATYDRADAWHPATDVIDEIVFDEGNATVCVDGLVAEPLVARGEADVDEAAARIAYERGFATIKRAIAAGDIYQANLSRRISVERTIEPAAAYRRLRALQPVPHGAYLDFGGFQILSNSPECFLRVDGEVVRTFPIKGTRPRARDRSRDKSLARELAKDSKERAEHVMIVDLERNDLGRVCRTGTVAVPDFAEVATFATLHHMISEVRGCLRPNASFADLLRATFPGGSITGAPKIRSMEIIAEVEPIARGVYTGSIGFLNGGRSLELSIAIRSAVATANALHYSTGGGIVADSTLAREWEETITKSRAFLDALSEPGGTARAGLAE